MKAADPNDGEVPSCAGAGAEENSRPAKNTPKRSGQSKEPGIKKPRGSYVVRQRKLDDGETYKDEVLLGTLLRTKNDKAAEPVEDHIAEVSFDLVDAQLLNPVVKKKK